MKPNKPHTPTPWTAKTLKYKALIQGGVYNTDSHSIAVVDSCPDDAAFIVRAVNAHEELLAACKAARTYLNLDDAGPELDFQLSQAIAKAESK